MWAKHDPRLFSVFVLFVGSLGPVCRNVCYLRYLLFVYGGALLIFRFCYGQFDDITLYWPSGRHRFSASVIPSVPLFCWPEHGIGFWPSRHCSFCIGVAERFDMASVIPSDFIASVIPSDLI